MVVVDLASRPDLSSIEVIEADGSAACENHTTIAREYQIPLSVAGWIVDGAGALKIAQTRVRPIMILFSGFADWWGILYEHAYDP